MLEVLEEIHTCKNLETENADRKKWREPLIYIFKEGATLNIKIGLEFLTINYCPLCGEKA